MDQDDLIRKLIEAIERNQGKSSSAVNVKDMAEFNKYLDGLNKTLEKNKATFGSFTKELITGKRAFIDFEARIEALDEQIEELSESVDQNSQHQLQQLKDKRETLSLAQKQQVAMRAGIDSLKAFGRGVADTIRIIGQGARTVARDITSGADAFTIAADAMDLQLDIHQGIVNTLGQTAQTAGAGLMMLGPYGIAAGLALEGVASAVMAYTSVMTEAQKFYNHFVLGEGTKILKAFEKISSAGGMFAKGATDMGRLAQQAGLTMAQFSDTVAKNADTLAASGLGVSGGAEMLSRSMRHLDDANGKTRRQLLNLGYTFEEQGDLFAQTMSIMRMANDPKIKDERAVHDATMQYAQNLRVLADLTGDDAKKRMENAKQMMYEAAFRNKLNEIYHGDTRKIQDVITGLAQMDQTRANAIKQQIALGVTLDKTTNIVNASMPGVGKGFRDMTSLIESGNFNLQEFSRLHGQSNDELRKNLGQVNSISMAAMAGTGQVAQEVGKGVGDMLKDADKITEQSAKDSFNAVNSQMNSTDKLTGTIVSATIMGQAMNVELEALARNELPNFGQAIRDVMNTIREMIGKAKGMKDDLQNKGHRIGENVSTAGMGTVLAGGAMFGVGTLLDLTGFLAPVGIAMQGIGAGMVTGGAATMAAGDYMQYASDMPGYAKGGVADGPTTGYRALLHGTEAVVPLPDGKSIPIQLPMDVLAAEIATAMHEARQNEKYPEIEKLTEKLDKLISVMSSTTSGNGGGALMAMGPLGVMAEGISDMVDILGQQLDKNSEMSDHLRDSKELTRKLLNATA
jgi:hypothetical protein